MQDGRTQSVPDGPTLCIEKNKIKRRNRACAAAPQAPSDDKLQQWRALKKRKNSQHEALTRIIGRHSGGEGGEEDEEEANPSAATL